MPAAWGGSIWIGSGAAYYRGTTGDNCSHAHHLIQVIVGEGADVAITDERGVTAKSCGFFIPSGITHRIVPESDGASRDCLILFFEPFSTAGRMLSEAFSAQPPGIHPIDIEKSQKLRSLIASEICFGQSFVDTTASILTGEQWRYRPTDRRVAYALDLIERLRNDSGAFEHIASRLGISPRYLRKIFERETGITMQRFRLWIKMKTAIHHALSGESLTFASVLGGFSDAAHFSRTFRDLFGISPSCVFDEISKRNAIEKKRARKDSGAIITTTGHISDRARAA
ncbi:MAG: helix-turn-helix domain-containing protein [Pseudomonadota bacterium]